MTRPVAVLRPEPGNTATVARLRAAGLEPIALPLFAVRSLDWDPIDPTDYDGLMITSANTLRHGGAALAALHGLPVFAVGAATAKAAQAAGLDVVASGDRDAAAILEVARSRGFSRLLHIGGRERSIDTGGIIAKAIAVYASELANVSAADLESLVGSVALLHSARAARRLDALLDEARIRCDTVRIAALSDAVRIAAGPGWHAAVVAERPTDDSLVAVAQTLVD